MAQSPCSNSWTRTQVTDRSDSPSTASMASVTRLISSCFWLGVNTSLMTSMVTSGMTSSPSLPVRDTARNRVAEPNDVAEPELGEDVELCWRRSSDVLDRRFMILRFGSCTLDTEKCELRSEGAVVPIEPQVLALLR